MKSYKKSQFLYNLNIVHVLTALIACTFLLCFSPSLLASINHFLFVSIPYIRSFFFTPKCLFIVVNVIIVVLFGESKLVGSNSSSVHEIYCEYVERSQSLRQINNINEKKSGSSSVHEIYNEYAERSQSLKEINNINGKKSEMNSVKISVEDVKEKKEVKGKDEEEEKKEEDTEIKERDEEDDEEAGLDAAELNKRVEEFIARVNRQRWLEAKSGLCGES